MMLYEGEVVGGDFRLLRRLAAGGMGSVFLAEQLSTGQQRALKLMHSTLVADPRLRERFTQEARIGAQIPSHHVVQVIAAGVDPKLEVPWLAMELLAGEDLGAHAARRGPLPLAEVLQIFRQLCHALAAAHDRGIVHRDVKPENIFLAHLQGADVSSQVKVLDFGIAKFAADVRASGTAQVGTPLWMAPEQSDSRATVTPAADVWPLGLIAFRLLTGKHYFRTGNETEGGVSALFRESLIEPLVPALQRAQEYGAAALLPPGFDAWFGRAVVREPAQRFPSAREALAALEAMVSSPSMAVPAPATMPHFTPETRSWPGAPTSAAMARTSHTVARPSSGWIGLGIGLGVVIIAGAGLVVLGAGAYVFFGRSTELAAPVPAVSTAPPSAAADSASASAAETPASSSEGVTAPGIEPPTRRPGSAAGRPSPPASLAPAAPTGSVASAASAGPPPSDGLKPIDRAAVERKMANAVNAATIECRSLKHPDAGVESYSGQKGFRPDGTTSTFFQGAGGSRECVKNKIAGVQVGRYAHAQDWHVESFSFSVTIK